MFVLKSVPDLLKVFLYFVIVPNYSSKDFEESLFSLADNNLATRDQKPAKDISGNVPGDETGSLGIWLNITLFMFRTKRH